MTDPDVIVVVEPSSPDVVVITDPAPLPGLPPGGATAQILAKQSDGDYDAVWVTGGGEGGGPVSWDDILGAPSAFTPSTHASSHGSAGADPVTLNASQITAGTINVTRLPVGTTAGTVAAGDDPRFDSIGGGGGEGTVVSVNGVEPDEDGDVTLTASDVDAVPTTRTITAGTGLTGGGDLSDDVSLVVAYGTTSGTACEGDDERLSDARTPTEHAASHADGGSDELLLALSQIIDLLTELSKRPVLRVWDGSTYVDGEDAEIYVGGPSDPTGGDPSKIWISHPSS